MTERPILFSGPMVRALLDGSKTQTRRPLYVVTKNFGSACFDRRYPPPLLDFERPQHGPGEGFTLSGWRKAQPGDRLWVRETFAKIDGQTRPWIETDYRATYTHGDRLGDRLGIRKKWTPSIHMPRAASRITIEVIAMRVERLQAISETDAIAEGVERSEAEVTLAAQRFLIRQSIHVDRYARLWDSINGAGSWDANPWVWVIEFRRV